MSSAYIFKIRKSYLFFVLVAVNVLMLCAAVSVYGENPPSFVPGAPIPLILDPAISTFRVPPESHPRGARTATATIVTVNYQAAGEKDFWNSGFTCEAWPPAAQTAFDYAAGIWAGYLNSAVPITIQACWTDMGSPFLLGYAGAMNMPVVSGTAYPQALANVLYGYDPNDLTPDIAAAFNKTFNWYFGTDGNPPGGTVDFVSVVLHEICHGLGFVGLMDAYCNSSDCTSSPGSWFGSWWGAFPAVYDNFAVNNFGQSLINESLFPNPSNALYLQLTGNNVYFNGANATAANGGSPAKLYAPSSWSSEASYSHLDYNKYRLTENALMVYKFSTGSAIHAPGPVTLGILKDIGWSINSSCSYSLSSAGSSFALSGGTGSVSVTTSTGCAWTAASNNPSWLTVTGGSSGSGDGTVNYSVTSYTGLGSRMGTMTIGGQTFTVNQTGCTYTLTPDHQDFTAVGGTTTFSVATNGVSCPWSPSESLLWVAVNSGAGPGGGSANYTVAANPLPTTRTGNINVGDKSFMVTQTGVPPVANFSGAPLSGNIAPFQVTFTDLSTNVTSWSWNFGDGGASALQNPAHTFKSTGPYDISLTVTNANGTDTMTRTSYISASSCGNSPVRRAGNPNTSIQAAYDEIVPGGTDTIDIQAVDITGALTFGASKTVTLMGGYTCDYLSRIPGTVVTGGITIGDAEITFDNIAIQ